MGRILPAGLAGLYLACLSTGAGAALIFSDDFGSGGFDAEWVGTIDDLSSSTDVDPNSDPRFRIVSGQARISVDDVFHVNSLRRPIDLVGASGPLLLSFRFDWIPTDLALDAVSINLEGVSGVPGETLKVLDDFASFADIAAATAITDFDVSAAAGQSVDLTFNLLDFSSPFVMDPPDDLLTIGDLVIEQQISVSEPATVLLLGMGLLGLRRRGRR